MAKAAISKKLTTKPKVVKPRLTRTAVKSIDDKYYGSEPIDISTRGLGDALCSSDIALCVFTALHIFEDPITDAFLVMHIVIPVKRITETSNRDIDRF